MEAKRLLGAGAIPSTRSGTISMLQVPCRQANLFLPIQVGWQFPSSPCYMEELWLKPLIDGMKSNCPARGIRYQPKRNHLPDPTQTFTTTDTAKPTATGIPFQGLGNLKVSTLGQGRGCIISHGTWFTSGTCATFRGERIRGLLILLTQKVLQINPRHLTISPIYRQHLQFDVQQGAMHLWTKHLNLRTACE